MLASLMASHALPVTARHNIRGRDPRAKCGVPVATSRVEHVGDFDEGGGCPGRLRNLKSTAANGDCSWFLRRFGAQGEINDEVRIHEPRQYGLTGKVDDSSSVGDRNIDSDGMNSPVLNHDRRAFETARRPHRFDAGVAQGHDVLTGGARRAPHRQDRHASSSKPVLDRSIDRGWTCARIHVGLNAQ